MTYKDDLDPSERKQGSCFIKTWHVVDLRLHVATGLLLSQVMACFHWLNQYWLIINRACWHLAEGDFTETDLCCHHYIDVIMTTIVSQITSLTVVYSTVYSDADQRKHQSSASLAFVWGIHRDRWIPRTKGQLREKCFHLMTSSWPYWPVYLTNDL